MEPFVPIIRLSVVTPKNDCTLFYLNEFLRNVNFEDPGSVQKQLTSPQVSKIKIICPRRDVLEKHKSIISNLVRNIEISRRETDQLFKFRDWLLPMLMNGQVTISNE